MNQTPSPVRLGGPVAVYALVLVSLTQAVSLMDRQILAILLPRIKADLRVGDAEMGLLYGTVFALFYAVFSLPLGRLADGWVRTRLLSIAIVVWSAMTALGGFASSFTTLALSRLGVGIGEASAQPAGMSLLADSFPKSARGTIASVLAAGVSLGLGGALLLGGAVVAWWDASWPNAVGAPLGLRAWQAAFLIAAIPGLVLGLLLAGLPEPVRGAADGIASPPDPAPFKASWLTLYAILPVANWFYLAGKRAPARTWAGNLAGIALIALAAWALTAWTNAIRPPMGVSLKLGGIELGGNALQWLISGIGAVIVLNWLQSLRVQDKPAFALIGASTATWLTTAIAAIQTLVNYAVMGWTPTYLTRHFHLSALEVGQQFGVLSAVIGIIGPLVAGPVSDWIGQRLGGGRLYVTLISLGLSPLPGILAYRAETLAGFYLYFSVYSFLLTMWMPPIYATFLDLVLPRMRGSVMSFYIMTMTIVGLGTGPYLIGLMSDINGGDIASAILTLYWLSPVLVILTIALIFAFPRHEAAMLDRARAAGEPI